MELKFLFQLPVTTHVLERVTQDTKDLKSNNATDIKAKEDPTKVNCNVFETGKYWD